MFGWLIMNGQLSAKQTELLELEMGRTLNVIEGMWYEVRVLEVGIAEMQNMLY